MDRNYIEQHLLIDRYLQDALGESEQAAFEERLVWDQALVDEVELAERLREGMRASAESQEEVGDSDRFSLVAMMSSVFAVPQYAAAASFLFAVMLTAGVFLSPYLDTGSSPGTTATRTEIIPLLTVRSTDVQTIDIDQGSWTVLLVEVMGDYTSYRATVRADEPDAPPAWMRDGITPTYLDTLAIGMPGSTLESGRYVLSLEGARDTEDGQRTYEHIQDIAFDAVVSD